MKIRRIDFSPDEYLAGVAGMTLEAQGLYWLVCALIYSTGGPIRCDDERLIRLSGLRVDHLQKRIRTLVETDYKLAKTELMLSCRRATVELERSYRRASLGWKGAEARWRKGLPDAVASNLALPDRNANHQPSTSNHQPSTTPASAKSSDPDPRAKARELIETFNRAQRTVFAEQRRTFPHPTDIVTASRWVEAGVTPDLLADVIEPIFARRKAAGQDAPSSLSYLDKPVRRAIAAPGRSSPHHDAEPTTATTVPPTPTSTALDAARAHYRGCCRYDLNIRWPDPAKPVASLPPDQTGALSAWCWAIDDWITSDGVGEMPIVDDYRDLPRGGPKRKPFPASTVRSRRARGLIDEPDSAKAAASK